MFPVLNVLAALPWRLIGAGALAVVLFVLASWLCGLAPSLEPLGLPGCLGLVRPVLFLFKLGPRFPLVGSRLVRQLAAMLQSPGPVVQ